MVAVPEEHKDEKYWEKRLKNKEATRRSREAKRLKQNQIALRAAHLERENKTLREQIEAAKRLEILCQSRILLGNAMSKRCIQDYIDIVGM